MPKRLGIKCLGIRICGAPHGEKGMASGKSLLQLGGFAAIAGFSTPKDGIANSFDGFTEKLDDADFLFAC